MHAHIPSISPELLTHRLLQGEALQLIDVRPVRDYRAEHVRDSISVPLSGTRKSGFQDQLVSAGLDADRTVFLLSNTREEAVAAAEWMQQTNAGRPVIVSGGIESWRAAGLALETPDSLLDSLNPTRAVIGITLLLSAILGYFVSPAFLLIVAAIGGGLVLPAEYLAQLLQKRPRPSSTRGATRLGLRNTDCPSQ